MTNERTNERLEEVSSHSLDITEQNIEKLKELFPEVLTEKKIDFDKLRLILGDEVETAPERYNFTWNGKKQVMQLAQQPTVATLKPNKAKSKNWDETQNLYIEGDNLEVLKILQKSYANKVKLIYLDPPYNTGSDFVYKDSFSDSLENYLEVTCQVDDEGKKFSTNSDTDGRYHTNWLNMMYPRLKLARNLLRQDGVIAISIDDNEVAKLRNLLDETFGENNFIQEIAWRRSDNQANIGLAARVKEYILIYAKNKKELVYGRLPLSESAIREYRYSDSYAGKFRRGILLDKTRGRYSYPVTTKSGNVLNGPWMVAEEKFKELDENNGIYWTSGGEEQPYSKIYLSESKGAIPNDFWGIEYGTNQRASLEVEVLFGERYFDFPKPVSLIKSLISLGAPDKDDIVLDFFSGSGTTAQAVMESNIDDDGKRKFILVQLPEDIDAKHKAYKAGMRKIPEIAEKRISLAGDKIIAENPELAGKLDVGFKVFELSKSNIKKWNAEPKDLNEQFELLANNFEEGSKPIDVVYEIMLKQGLDLTYPISETKVGDAVVYDIAFGAIFVVLGDKITSEVASHIIKQIADEEAENSVVVLQDEKFINDSEKLNTIEQLNASGIQYNDILSI